MINFNINLKSINGESLLGNTDIVIPVVTSTSQLTNNSGFITTSALTGFATESWVEAKNYLTAASLITYATESWVEAKNYLTASSLTGYATETYVNNAISTLNIPESFLDLNDTPNSYSGQGGKLVAVNNTNDGLVFITPTASNQVQSDWNQTDPLEVDYIKNKPVIPSIVGLATEQYVDDEIDALVIPTKTSDLTNDSGFITSSALTPYTTKTYVDGEIDSVEGQITNLDNSLATVAKTGSYDDLTDKPVIPSEQVNSDWNAVSGKAQILNKPTLFDGDYNSLTNKPIIPTDIDDLTDNNNLLFDGDYNSLTNKPDLSSFATTSYVDNEINALVIPTKTSDLTNDSGFIDSSALSSYSTTTQMNTAISNKVDKVNVSTVTANKTLNVVNDYGKFLYITTSTTLTIPTNASQAFEIGTRIDGYSTVASLEIVASSGVTLISNESKKKIVQNSGFSLTKVTTNTWLLVGLLEA